MKEKTKEFCENFNVAGKKYGFDCPGFTLPSRKDFDEIGNSNIIQNHQFFPIKYCLFDSGCQFGMDTGPVHFLHGMYLI